MAIDDETRTQFIFDIFDVCRKGVISQAETKILLYHSLDWKSIQLEKNGAATANPRIGGGITSSN
jgi:hypothetical protein